MSDFMETWLSLTVAFAIGFLPLQSAMGVGNLLTGERDSRKHPNGCLTTYGVLFLVGFPLTWVVWHYFRVVWR